MGMSRFRWASTNRLVPIYLFCEGWVGTAIGERPLGRSVASYVGWVHAAIARARPQASGVKSGFVASFKPICVAFACLGPLP
jgi:hypothetical protein